MKVDFKTVAIDIKECLLSLRYFNSIPDLRELLEDPAIEVWLESLDNKTEEEIERFLSNEPRKMKPNDDNSSGFYDGGYRIRLNTSKKFLGVRHLALSIWLLYGGVKPNQEFFVNFEFQKVNREGHTDLLPLSETSFEIKGFHTVDGYPEIVLVTHLFNELDKLRETLDQPATIN
ncbi:MAG: hypothetical protein WCT16_03290 [Candidatus Buchananbacteria bacterium]